MAGESKTERSILDSILADDNDAGGQDDNQQDAGDNGSDDNDGANEDLPDDLLEPEQRRAKEDKADAGDDDGGEPERDQRQQQKARQPEQKQPAAKDVDEFDPKIRLQEDKAGNLLSPTGRLVARAGRERAIFLRFRSVATKDRAAAVRLATRLNELAGKAKQLYTMYEGLKASKGMFDQAGLSFDEQKVMLDVAITYKKSPLDGLKLMLTKAHMTGVDISKLTGGQGGGLDPRAITDEIKRHFDERFKPVADLTSRSEEHDTFQSEASGFFTRNPLALSVSNEMGNKEFGVMLSEAKSRFPELTLDDIWQKIHYQIMLKGNPTPQRRDTAPVRRRGRPGNQPPRPPREESFEDIGRSVLRDLNSALNR